MTSPTMMIAIDGPAAAGKGTLARRLAEHYGLRHLDTGLTYRAVAAALVDGGRPLDDSASPSPRRGRSTSASSTATALSAQAVGEAASRVAVIPQVGARWSRSSALSPAAAGRGARRPRHRHGGSARTPT